MVGGKDMHSNPHASRPVCKKSIPGGIRKETYTALLTVVVFCCTAMLLNPAGTVSAQTNKTLVKTTSSPTVYWFQNNRLYGIADPSYINTQQSAGIPGWINIQPFSSLNFPQGPIFVNPNDNSSNGLLLKVFGGSPSVYLIENRQKRVLSQQEFNDRGLNFNDVIDVAQGILNLFPDAPNPTLNSVNPLTTPIAGQQFFARLSGNNFIVNAVEVVVTGTGCSPCVVPNSSLANKSTSQVDAPFTLSAGTFQIQVRNGSGGSLSASRSLVVNPPAPVNKTLVKTDSNPTIYWFQNNRLYGIASQNLINTQQAAGVSGWGTPTPFPTLSFPQGPIFVNPNDDSSNGLLLKTFGGSNVYVIENRKKLLLSLDEFNRRGYSFDNVIDTVQSIINQFPDAPPPGPTLDAVNPLTTPVANKQFLARLTGTNFSTSTVEVLVNGPGCTNCVISNNVLSSKSGTQFDAPFTLGAGTYQVQVRNGSSGTLSGARSLVVNSAPPANKTLVKTTSDPTVYWLQNNRLYPVASQNLIDTQRNAGVPGWTPPNSFSTLSFSIGPIFVNTSDNSSNGLLLKLFGSNPAIYLIENRQKRVLSLEEFTQRGFSFSDVIEVAQSILNLFPSAPSTPAPTLNNVVPLTSPMPGVRFNARLEGASFDSATAEIVVVGPGCAFVGACIVPNSVLRPGGITSTIISSAPFTLGEGTFDIFVRNGGSGTLSSVFRLTVNPPVPTPKIDDIGFSRTPVAGQPFVVDLTGTGFQPNTVRIEITGPLCSPCLRENNTLLAKTTTRVSVEVVLNNTGVFQIALRNGIGGTLSNVKPINVVQQPPSTVSLSVLVAIADKRWPIDKAHRIFMDLRNQRTGASRNEQLSSGTARHQFNDLTTDKYDLLVTVEYIEAGNNGLKPDVTRQVKFGKNDIDLKTSLEIDLLLPPIVVMVHGIRSDYGKWSSWQQYLNAVGLGDTNEPRGFVTLQPDYRVNVNNKPDTSIPVLGGWEAVVQNIVDQLNSSLSRLTSNNASWPPIYYIGHSQGGLIGRVLLAGKQWRSPISTSIKRFYMLGTPNSGALLSVGEDLEQYYGYLTHDAVMKDFNVAYPDLGLFDNAKVRVFAGTQFVLGDGVVPTWSVFEVRQKFCGFLPVDSDCGEVVVLSFDKKTFSTLHHFELGSEESLDKILVQEIISELRDGETSGQLASRSQDTATAASSSSDGVTMRRVHSRKAALAGGEELLVPFTISNSDLTIVNALSQIGSADYFLLNPAGQIIDSADSSLTVVSDESGQWFVLRNPTVGRWTLRIRASQSNTKVALTIQESSPIGFQAYAVDSQVQQGGRAALLGKWVGSISGTEATNILADVRSANGATLETIALFDDGAHSDGSAGDGVFGGLTSSFSNPGRYIVSVRSEGTYQGVPFTREAADPIDVLPATHLFTGQFSDAAVDTNGDSISETVRVTAPVNLSASGNYVVTGELYDAQGYLIDRSTSLLEANTSGSFSPQLDFDVSRATCNQFDRAFTVRNISLTDASSFRVWDHWGTDVTTRIFDGLAFQCVTVPTGLQITAVQPNSIVKGNSVQVFVSGSGFSDGATLSFGSQVSVSSLTLLSNGLLMAQLNADANAAAGSRDVVVTNPDGHSITAPGLFNVSTDQPPTVALTSPTPLQNLEGSVIVSASAFDDLGVQRVEFYVDGGLLGTDSAFPYQVNWNTSASPPGSRTLVARAFDTLGQMGSDQIGVTVGCNYAISPASQSFNAAGASGTVTVTAPAGCGWSATSNNLWITISSGSTGSGNGTVGFSVGVHTGTEQRSGTLTIAGKTFTVNQSPTQNGDSDSDSIPDSVEAQEGTNPSIKDNAIFTNARLFAMQQYRDFLGREGDAGGILFWTNTISSGARSRAQAIEDFFNSSEFQNTTAPVTHLYFAYFRRIPDTGGLLFWVNARKNGASLETISDAFAGSPEFQQTYGSLNNVQFVTLVYQNVLGRAPDQAGLNFWVGHLNAATLTRGQVMLAFSESAENKQGSRNKVFVVQIYVGMLRRSPDQGGFDFWLNALNSGASGLNLIQAFLSAAEYRTRFLPRVVVDGEISDWVGVPDLLTDPVGDGPLDGAGVYYPGSDFVKIRVNNDSANVYILLEFAEGPFFGGITLHLDTDLNVSTGCTGSEYAVFVAGSGPGTRLTLADHRSCGLNNDFPTAVTSRAESRFVELSIAISSLRVITPGINSFRLYATALTPTPGTPETVGPPATYSFR